MHSRQREGGQMADYKTDIIGQLAVCLMQHGIDPGDARAEISIILHDYDVVPRTTEIVPYEANATVSLIKRFLIAKKVKGLTRRTLEYYQTTLRTILTKIGKQVTSITSEDVVFYLACEMRRGVSKCTVGNMRRVLSSFFAWAQREEIITKNPMLKVEKIKFIKIKEAAFDAMEIERMRTCLRDWREKAIFELFLSTGCRAAEIQHIRIADINDDKIVILGKGEKYRTVYINARARVALEQYMLQRIDNSQWLFPSGKYQMFRERCKGINREKRHMWWTMPEYIDEGAPISAASLRVTLRKAGARAGVQNVHPHRFRRTCASMARERGMDISLISRMLGHESIATTQIYLDISDTSVEEAHKKYVN